MYLKIFFWFCIMLVVNLSRAQAIDSIAAKCVQDNYALKGVSIDSVLDSFEKHLIKEGYLGTTKENRYSFFYQKMAKENTFIGMIPESIMSEISKVEIGKHMGGNCFNDLKSMHPDDVDGVSKLFLMIKQYEKIERTYDAPKEIAQFMLDTFNENEFQSSFLRIQVLLTIAWVSDLNRYPVAPLLPPIKN